MEKLPIPVPPMLEKALDYPGDAEWVSFYWEMAGDEARYDDGRISADGEWDAYLYYTRHPAVAPYLASYDLGSSDGPGRHRLLLHRPTRTMYAGEVAEVRETLWEQWERRGGLPELTPEQLDEAMREWSRRVEERASRPQEEIMAEVHARMQAHYRVTDELADWMESQPLPERVAPVFLTIEELDKLVGKDTSDR